MKYWTDFTSSELEKQFSTKDTTLILPFGSVEQHGKHLAVSYDYKIAEKISLDISRKNQRFYYFTYSHDW